MNESVACIAYKNGKVLIAHRNNVGAMGNRWEFPGGKVEKGESFEDAIKREMKEEFCVDCIPLDFISKADFLHKEKIRTVYAYLVELQHDGIECSYKLSEHTEYKWVNINEIMNLDFVDSDLKLYPAIVEYLKNKN